MLGWVFHPSGREEAEGRWLRRWLRRQQVFFSSPPDKQQTNHRAELRAGLYALERAQQGVETHLITDSPYLSLGISGRVAKWKRGDWHTKDLYL